MPGYEIELEIFEGKGATIAGPPFPDLAKEGICAWMLGKEACPKNRDEQTRDSQDPGNLCAGMVDSPTDLIRCARERRHASWRDRGTSYENEIGSGWRCG